MTRLAFFGGLYSNYLALQSAITDAHSRGVDAIYCLGDLGAFGPHPDRVFPLLHQHGIECVRGNYDDSIGFEKDDCQCGYTDPRDNYFAQISYEYTLAGTSQDNRRWLQQLPTEIRLNVDGLNVLLCHGSPRRTNEFLWESTTSTQFLNRLADEHEADVIVGSHSGIHWQRVLSHGRRYINAGVLGRPANDGRTHVWYAIVEFDSADPNALPCTHGGRAVNVHVEFVPVVYDYQRLASEMRAEQLPEEFITTVLSGWWTTCLEVLPARERRAGRY
ncbi:MAG: metallophosphoesterase family protein [Fuerstiella sp.]